jgi:biotin carboxyl carrier protein
MAWALGADATMKYVTIIKDKQYEIEVDEKGAILVNGEPRNVDFLGLDPSLYSIIINNESLQAVIEQEGDRIDVQLLGRQYEARVLDERALLLATRKGGLTTNSGELHSPMPGLIVKVQVQPGEVVEKGKTLVILESMKMQNELKAPASGTVVDILCTEGATVEKGALLISIELPEEA